MTEVSPRTCARLAYIAAALNLAAALAMLLALKPGLPVPESQLAERMAYLREHTRLWWGGWLIWHAAALSLLAFYVGLAGLWGRRAPVRATLALLCGAAGLAADLAAEAVSMGIAPRLEAEGLRVAEDLTGILTGYLGNGLYTVAGILLTWAGAMELPRPLLALAGAVWTAGLALSITSLALSAAGQFWSTAILMPLFVAWATLVGRWLSARAS